MNYKLLLGQCFDAQSQPPGEVFKYPHKYIEALLDFYPDIQPWVTSELYEKITDKPPMPYMTMTREPTNVAGHFIAENIKTDTKVIDIPLNPKVIEKELSKENYTHIGIGIYINCYRDFIKCSNFIRKNYPEIKIIVGNVGVMYAETEKYTDYICYGDGIRFFRELFNEPTGDAYQPVLVPDNYYVKVMGKNLLRPAVNITTQIGCPNRCDFCVTNHYFNGYSSGHLFSPRMVYKAIMGYREKVGQDFLVYFAEPTAIVQKQWWYELFDLFRHEKGDYPLILLTTIASLKKLDLDLVSNSALRIELVNVGIESFSRSYKKVNTDVKKLIKKYKAYGIGLYLTYIIGFDHNTHENVLEEMAQLVELGAAMSTIQNLHPSPGTTVWRQMSQDNRLLDLPIDFYNIEGFQPYRHPHFKPGLVDLLPLMVKIYRFLEEVQGPTLGSYYELTKNLISSSKTPRKIYYDKLKEYKMANKFLYPAWKNHFKPNPDILNLYEKKTEVSYLYKKLTDIPVYSNIINGINRYIMG